MSSKSERIGLDSCVGRPKELPTAEVGGEVVMMSLDKGKYFALDSVGSRIWELMEKPQTVKEIIQCLLEEYEVDEQTCRNNVLEFLNKLDEEGLMELIEDR
ncbi:hypothetical protein Sgly_1621 [Syntrophobotulus glycolicus DSM 8271]|uniref:Coenzyme PQQ synthesis protein D (PqqD) n=2 Tax=Syntrophobotulus TaxID=51196 RepID=F0SY84_SYNGF|nr:hypothetical protein Sgly_1621 [Syntrophobotulus glycolicus DSM 8271]